MLGILASLLGDFDHVEITSESHWSIFKKTFIFQMDLNDFMQLLGHFGAMLGPIFAKNMEDKSRKVKSGSQKWHADVEGGYVGGCGGYVGGLGPFKFEKVPHFAGREHNP